MCTWLLTHNRWCCSVLPTKRSKNNGFSYKSRKNRSPYSAPGLLPWREETRESKRSKVRALSMISQSRWADVLSTAYSVAYRVFAQNSASRLERLINGWAVEVVRMHRPQLSEIRQAAVSDIYEGYPPEEEEVTRGDATAMQVQNLLRHAISQAISEGIVNCLIVTNSQEANVQLTRIHEHIFTRKQSYACSRTRVNVEPPQAIRQWLPYGDVRPSRRPSKCSQPRCLN